MARHALTPVHIAARVTAGIFGAYAFTWGFAAAGVAALTGLGVAYHDAEMGVLMLAFLVFLGLFLWSFAAVSISLAKVRQLAAPVCLSHPASVFLCAASSSAGVGFSPFWMAFRFFRYILATVGLRDTTRDSFGFTVRA